MNVVKSGVGAVRKYAYGSTQDAEEKRRMLELHNSLQSRTLLPGSIASFVSAVSLCTRVSLRLSAFWIEAMLETARRGSTTSLSLTRQALISAVSAASHYHPKGIDDDEYTGLLEHYTQCGVFFIHTSFSLVELFTMSGISLAGTALKTGYTAAEESVKLIEGIFGSTESSRALAAIIGLVRRELTHDPRFTPGQAGTVATLSSLTKAITAFACLQIATSKRTAAEQKTSTLFDGVVIARSKDTTSAKQRAPQMQRSSSDDEVSRQLTELVGQDGEESFEHAPADETHAVNLEQLRPPTNSQRLVMETVTMSETRQRVYLEDDDSQMMEDDEWVRLNAAEEEAQPTKALTLAEQTSEYLPTRKLRNVFGSVTKRFTRSKHVVTPESRTSASSHHQERTTFEPDSESPTHRRRPSQALSDLFVRRPAISISPVHNEQKTIEASPLPVPPSSPRKRKTANPPLDSAGPSRRSRIEEEETCTRSFMQQEPRPTNFPQKHLVWNLKRFVRYSSASYGSTFLRLLGMSNQSFPSTSHPANHQSFCHHAGIPLQNLLLSSFMESDTLDNSRLEKLIYYCAVDDEAQAIVLACRGSLGLSDLLTDLTADYEEIKLPDAPADGNYRVHRGILNAAEHLASDRSTVHGVVKRALLEHPNYGLVLCGHSLGGGVAATLALLLACPNKKDATVSHNAPWITSINSGLPPGRPIHAYSYGGPCVGTTDVVSWSANLVTSVVHKNDLVPCLSLSILSIDQFIQSNISGVLMDLKEIAINMHEEPRLAQEIVGRVTGLYQSKSLTQLKLPGANSSNSQQPMTLSPEDLAVGKAIDLSSRPGYSDPRKQPTSGVEDTEQADWLWSLMTTIRASNSHSQKVYPIGQVLSIEASDLSVSSQGLDGTSQQARAQRVILRNVDDVESRFGEPLFDRTMLFDHSPTNYENAILALYQAVLDP